MSAEDLVEKFYCEQGSDEWFALKTGSLTASNFSVLLRDADAKTRTSALYRIAGEILSGQPAETYENDAMRRGKFQEPLALAAYGFTRGVEVERIGFVRRTVRCPLGQDFQVGCSPDGLIGGDDDGGIESKSLKPELIVAMVESGHFPSEHKPQVMGNIWVTGRRWFDLRISYTGMPIERTFRIERDEIYIRQLRDGAERFMWELSELVKRVKRKGGVK